MKKSITLYIEIDPLAGTYSVFEVKTASNPNYLIKAIYDMYKANLDKKLAVKAVRNLFLSIGMGSVGLNNLLKKFGMNLTPAEFFMLVFKLQHQQGWGVPFKLVGKCQSEVFIDGGFEGVLIAVTGKNWFCSEIKCQANGDDCCEFVADKKRIQLEMEGRGYRQR